jgi:integrase
VVNYREAGKRKRKFFETKDTASSFAAFKNDERQRNGMEHSEFPTALRVMAQDAVEQLKPFGKTITDAVRHYVAHLKASERSCTAQQLVRELLKAKESDGASESHLRDIRCRLAVFAEKFDGQMVATITSKEIDDWLRSLPFSPLTRNRYRQLVVLAFNFAVRHGYAMANPAMGAAKARVVGKAPGILTVSETARLLETAAPDILPYLAIGAFAGLRRAELKRLDWSEIDFESGLIEVKARKAAGIVKWPGNSLRHSFASYHLAHFKNAAATALELGHHDTRITFAHYRELVKPKDAERYWNIRPSISEKIVPLTVGI